MRTKYTTSIIIVFFLLSGLVLNSVFAVPIDPEKETSLSDFALQEKLISDPEKTNPPVSPPASVFYEGIDNGRENIDAFSPIRRTNSNIFSPSQAQHSSEVDAVVASLIQETVVGSSPWQQLNEDGFGDNNFQIPSLQEFNGDLYAGTWKDNDEVSSAEVWRTIDGGGWEKVDEREYSGCADLIVFGTYLYCGSWDGAIWRSEDGINWADVVTDGFGDSNNGIARFAVFDGMLYAGTWNGTTGTEIWRTDDGTDWDIFGDGLDPNNIAVGAISTEVFGDYLYWGLVNWETGAQLWRTDGITLTKVSQGTSAAISSLAAFDGFLYSGIWDEVSTQVWRSDDGVDWEHVLTFSDLGSGMREANGLEVYDNMLYLVGANPDNGLEVWRTSNGSDWELSASMGFGDTSNAWSYWDNAITNFGGKLILGTNNFSTGGEIWGYEPNEYEVYDVEMWLNLGVKDWIWGNAKPGLEVTITTPRDTIHTFADPGCNGCFGISEPIEINAGDTISVTAGDAIYPVDFTLPTPLLFNARSDTEEVWGQIGGRSGDLVQVNGFWEDGYQEVTTDPEGNFSIFYSDIPRGGDGFVRFTIVEDQADVIYHQYFRTADLILEIYPFADVIEGPYAPDHSILLTVKDSEDNLKAEITVTTGDVAWWDGRTGFAIQSDESSWNPSRPDILPGDKIYGVVDGGTYQAYAQVGEITGEVTADTDSISGTIHAPWLIPDPGMVKVECYGWGAPEGAPDKYATIIPGGTDPYNCAWDPLTEWDVEPNQWIGVAYRDPDDNRIIEGFYEADYNLYLHVNYYGDVIEFWYPPDHEGTLTVTESDGVTVKATVDFTTTSIPWWNGDTGFSTDLDGVVWDPERPDIQAGDWVFGEVDVDGTIYSAEVQLGEILGEVDAENDSITGTIDVPWLPQDVEIEMQCHPWGAPNPTDGKQDFVLPDGEDPYFCEWDPDTEWDIQPYSDVGVTYTDPSGHWVYNGFYAYSFDLSLNVNYGHDWIEFWYPPDYSGTLTVTESDRTTVKATMGFTTTTVPWWGGATGFSTNMEGVVWNPERPDIQAGDWVFGEVDVDGTIYSAEVQLGEILGEVDAENDSITGTIYAPWLPQDTEVWVWCHTWGAPPDTEGKGETVLPDGVDTYTCAWDPDTEWDIQPNQEIGVSYTGPDNHTVYNVFIGYIDELILQIHYDHDWIQGFYEPDHTVSLQVLDQEGVEKAHITVPTGFWPDWGGQSGFATHLEGSQWLPSQPDIQPGDMVHGEVDDGSEFTADVQIGWVTADLDLDNDQVSGTVDAEWLPQGEDVKAACYIWENYAPPNQEDWVLPDGVDTYLCDWTDDGYDLNETSNLMVAYIDPAGHELIGDFHPPAPRLRIEKWLENGEPGEGGNVTFRIQYRNEGDAPAVNAIITDIFEQGLTYLSDTSGLPKDVVGNQVIWQLGDLAPTDWVNFYVFAHVIAPAGEEIINTAEISSESFDPGNPDDRVRTARSTVVANNTHVNVGKGTWTWLPAPGEKYVYNINVCNNGPTGSTELTLTENLPDVVTFDSFWGREDGWHQISLVDNLLTLEYPTIAGYSCREVFIKVILDPDTQPGDELVNSAEISADNDDPEEQDNQASLHHNVGEPNVDLSISLGWHSGVLTPGGQYRFGIYFYNNGNLPVEGPIALTLTLPAGTSFAGWSHWDWAEYLGDPVQDGNTITWQVDDLDAGYNGTVEVIANIHPATTPETELLQIADIEVQSEEGDINNNTSELLEVVRDHGPNLRVRKWGDWHGHGEGHNAWFQLFVENIGDQTVTDVFLEDHYPTQMDLDGGVNVGYWEASDLDLYPEEHYFTLTLDRLEPGWSMGVNYNLVIPGSDPVPLGQVFTNTAEVTVDPAETYPEDNIAVYLLGSGPNMFVEKSLGEGEFLPGEEVSFLIKLGNDQPGHTRQWDMVGNAILVDTLPDGMTFVSAYRHCYEEFEWCEFIPDSVGQEIIWTMWPMTTGEWTEVWLTLRIDDEIPASAELINTAEILSSEPEIDLDPFPENNASVYDPEVNFEAPMITSADNTTFIYGELGSFVITTSGFPTPMIWTGDGLPSWLTLVDQGDGTAILSGMPPEEGGVDYFILNAGNGVIPNAQQSFILTWEGAPDYEIFLPLILK